MRRLLLFLIKNTLRLVESCCVKLSSGGRWVALWGINFRMLLVLLVFARVFERFPGARRGNN